MTYYQLNQYNSYYQLGTYLLSNHSMEGDSDYNMESSSEEVHLDLAKSVEGFATSMVRFGELLERTRENFRQMSDIETMPTDTTVSELTKENLSLRRENDRLKREIVQLKAMQLRGSPYPRDYFIAPPALQQPNRVCYFHSKFGAAANRCQPPCNWQANMEMNK